MFNNLIFSISQDIRHFISFTNEVFLRILCLFCIVCVLKYNKKKMEFLVGMKIPHFKNQNLNKQKMFKQNQK